MFKNLIFLLFSVILCSNIACFAPGKYFTNIPLESGESAKYNLPADELLRITNQILLLHDFKLSAPIRDAENAIVVVGERITTELLWQKPLSDGAVRIRIRSLSSQESQIWFVWHSFYRKRLKNKIQEDVKANTARFWEILNVRILNK